MNIETYTVYGSMPHGCLYVVPEFRPGRRGSRKTQKVSLKTRTARKRVATSRDTHTCDSQERHPLIERRRRAIFVSQRVGVKLLTRNFTGITTQDNGTEINIVGLSSTMVLNPKP